MGYYIYAWLENGEPQLQIVDAKSGGICLSWSYQSSVSERFDQKIEIQRLFKKLLLLTCKQEINNVRIFDAKPLLKNKSKLLLDRKLAYGEGGDRPNWIV